jgi:prophage DNA circulation protein
MSWEDRLQQAAITTQDGERYIFQYEDVSIEYSKKITKYTFSDQKGALVQDFGVGEIGLPLECIFSGINYDITANAFETSLSIPGSVLLEHPIYGNKNVSIESFSRLDRLKTANGQAIFQLLVTVDLISESPTSTGETRSIILALQEDFINTSGEVFEQLNAENVADEIDSQTRIQAFVETTKSTFQEIVAQSDEIENTFNTIADNIIQNIDNLIQDPLSLGASIQRLVYTPARLVEAIQTRLSTYADFISNLIASPVDQSNSVDTYNQRIEKQLFVTGAVSAITQATLFGEFTTKAEATEAAAQILSILDEVQEYLDDEEQTNILNSLTKRYVVSDAITDELKTIVATAAARLVQLSFSLKQERIITTTRKRTIIDLCFELYKTTEEEELSFFINTNGLTGEELLLIPKGKEIKYYV